MKFFYPLTGRNCLLCLLLCGGVSLFAQPANDDCENAIAIELGVPFESDNTGATQDDIPLVGGSCGNYQVNNSDDPGVFFSFVAPAEPVNIVFVGSVSTRIAVLSGTCSTELNCVATEFEQGGITMVNNLQLMRGKFISLFWMG